MFLLQTITPEAERIANQFSRDSLVTKGAQIAEILRNTPPKELIEEVINSIIKFGLKVLLAFLLYLIGAWIIRKTKNIIARAFTRKGADAALSSFIRSLVATIMWIILIIFMIGLLGMNTTALAALLAAGGVAIGMSLSGTVQNFAGGLMLLAYKPFKAGDFIETQGFAGIVKEINIVSTKLTTMDNKVVILPNGALSNGSINNFSSNPIRRIEIPVNLPYGTDTETVRSMRMDMGADEEKVIDATTPGAADPFVGLKNMKDSSVEFILRVWVASADYWPVYFHLNEAIYKTLPERGIGFPFPQLDVHVNKN